MFLNPWKMVSLKKLKLKKKTQANCIFTTFVGTLSCMKKAYLTIFQILKKWPQYVTFS